MAAAVNEISVRLPNRIPPDRWPPALNQYGIGLVESHQSVNVAAVEGIDKHGMDFGWSQRRHVFLIIRRDADAGCGQFAGRNARNLLVLVLELVQLPIDATIGQQLLV